MIEFIDKTSTQSGTPINRANLMAIQGFVKQDTDFEDDFVVVRNDKNETLTISKGVNENGEPTITETFVGEFTIVKTTTFKNDGNISEVIA